MSSQTKGVGLDAAHGLQSGLSVGHALLALTVVFVWGTNFVVIKAGLREFPPFFLATLRFTLSCLPWVFLIPRPPVALRKLAAFGVLQGAGQFGLLYYAMRADISPGVASLVIQSQVFFTIGAAVLWLGETVKPLQVLALSMALVGIGIIGWQSLFDPTASVTLAGLGLTLVAGLCWSISNLVARSAGRVNMLHFMVWSSLFSVPPLLVSSLVFEPAGSQLHSLTAASTAAWGVVLWQALGNTLFGFGTWNWLLARYESASITPIALLVPVFGIGASSLLLDEALPLWKIVATVLVLLALGVNTFSARQNRLRG